MAESREVSRLGIAFHVIVADRNAKTRVQVAPDSSGSPDTANSELLEILQPGKSLVVFRTPGQTGDVFHFRARHERSEYDDSSWTSWQAREVGVLPADYPPAPSGRDQPTAGEDVEETDQTGTLKLTVFDPHGEPLTVKFWTRTGKGTSFGTVDERTGVVSGTTVSKDVTLAEKHHSYIQYEVIGSNGETTDKKVIEFDPDSAAQVTVETIHEQGGQAFVELSGDSDTVSIWRKPEGDPDSNATKIADARFTDDTIDLTGQQQGYEYAGKNSAGRFGPFITVNVSGVAAASKPDVDLKRTAGGPADVTLDFDISPVPNNNSVGGYEVRWRQKLTTDQNWGSGWSSWEPASVASPLSIQVDRGRVNAKLLQAQARDTGLNDLEGPKEQDVIGPLADDEGHSPNNILNASAADEQSFTGGTSESPKTGPAIQI